MVELRLLGPVEIVVGGEVWEAGPRQQRHTLAALAVDAGRTVSTETLIDRVWDDPPPGARRALQSHITRIRRLLERAGAHDGQPARLERRSGGYVLNIAPDQVDVRRLGALVHQARARPDPATEVAESLTEAMALWRGEPLAGLDGQWVAQSRQAWRQRHLDATLLWAQAMLAQGLPEQVADRLTAIAGEYPLAEPLAAMVMRALSAAGRPAEALEYYGSIRGRLAEELGVDPSPELRSVHHGILRGEPERPQTPGALPIVPAQLPADVPGFVGRVDHLARLDALLAAGRPTGPKAMVVAAVSGTAGVGKTALAVHWAHQVAGEFPDGQLYVDLRGFTPAGTPTAPAEAVRGFLDAFGVPPERLPTGLDALAALYRSLVAGKRVLVVIDNARDAEQVRPLLPGTPTALVVTTSRDTLTPLLVNGAEPLLLSVLSDAEAHDLLVRRVSGPRVAAEPDAARQIVAACARLPLALAVVAARLQHSGFPLAVVAASFTDSGRQWDAWNAGDPAGQIPAVFSSSVAALSQPANRLFRLLGLHPGPTVTVAAAASLAGHSHSEVRRLLDDLTRVNLLAESSPGRYMFHDLLRAYSIDLVEVNEPEATRRAACLRMLDYYTHSAYRCALLLLAHRGPIDLPLDACSPGALPDQPADYQRSSAWLDDERHVLFALLRRAPSIGFPVHAWQLAWSLDTYLGLRGYNDDRIAAWEAGLRVAAALNEPIAQAYAHRRLGYDHTEPGRYAEAAHHLDAALHLYRQAGDEVGQAYAERDLGRVMDRQGDPQEALRHARRGLALFRSAGHRLGQGGTLNAIGWYLAHLGDHARAVASCEEALTVLQQVGDLGSQGFAWDSLGYAHHQLGHFEQAAGCFQQAIELFQETDNVQEEAATLVRLATTHRTAGDLHFARAALSAALSIYSGIDQRRAAAVKADLAGLNDSRWPGPHEEGAT